MKRLLDSNRMTPLGGALILILFAAVLVLLVGPRHDEAPALIVIVVILGMVVTNAIGPSSRWGGGGLKSLDQRREEFHPKRRRLGEAPPETEVEADAWARERARYEAQTTVHDTDEPGPFGG